MDEELTMLDEAIVAAHEGLEGLEPGTEEYKRQIDAINALYKTRLEDAKAADEIALKIKTAEEEMKFKREMAEKEFEMKSEEHEREMEFKESTAAEDQKIKKDASLWNKIAIAGGIIGGLITAGIHIWDVNRITTYEEENTITTKTEKMIPKLEFPRFR